MDDIGKSSMERATSDSAVNFDLMDELLSGDCWPEAPNYSELFQTSTSASTSPFCSSPFFNLNPDVANTTTNNNGSVANQRVEETQIADELEAINTTSEQSLNWLTQPRGPIVPLKDRLFHALRFIMESQRGTDVLVQTWVPIQREGRNFLTTCGQPFWLDSNSPSLSIYRSVSTNYQFSVEENSNEIVGLPGRVFLGKVPEWTPDVRYFTSDEYSRVDHAQRYNVCGTIALPVFERDCRSCVGVVELVLTTRKISYSSDLENICNALQAVDLRSSDVLGIPRIKVGENSYQAALPEIQQVLKATCETHALPLAQTWISCIQQGKQGSRHSSENYRDCVSTVDDACYVNDPSMLRFHLACSEHHLFRGQGVAGKAFTTNQPCFSDDITSFTKTQYPLSHHAKLFNLRGAVAIRLRSIHTGKVDFVLEFFLPINCIESEEQKLMLNTLSTTIQKVCRSLRIVSAKEMEEDAMLESEKLHPSVPLFDDSFSEEGQRPDDENILSVCSPSAGLANIMEVREKEASTLPTLMSSEFSMQEIEVFGVGNDWDTSEFKEHHLSTTNQNDFFPTNPNIVQTRKPTEKRRAKSEKTVSLQVLRQYFAGSLKDAAKSLGGVVDDDVVAVSIRSLVSSEVNSATIVARHRSGDQCSICARRDSNSGLCPTTLKRICRQHGINRWPSRKIKKVGHSLKKLQVVIDSVQGAEGTFQFSSVYENFAKASRHDKHLSLKKSDHPESSNTIQQQGGRLNSHTSASNSLSSSSCSMSSSSGLGCSSGSRQLIQAPQLVVKQESSIEENRIKKIARVNSGLELNLSGQEQKKSLVRSHSHVGLGANPSSVNPTQLQKKSPDVFKAKAVYGEEKVRFKLPTNWGLQELRQEVAKRFEINDACSINLKYLDDDSEWVLMTCDEDLQECVDVYKSCGGDTIKLSVHCTSQRFPRVSFGFQALS